MYGINIDLLRVCARKLPFVTLTRMWHLNVVYHNRVSQKRRVRIKLSISQKRVRLCTFIIASSFTIYRGNCNKSQVNWFGSCCNYIVKGVATIVPAFSATPWNQNKRFVMMYKVLISRLCIVQLQISDGTWSDYVDFNVYATWDIILV